MEPAKKTPAAEKMTAQGIRDLNVLGPTKKQRRLAREQESRASSQAAEPVADAPAAAPPE